MTDRQGVTIKRQDELERTGNWLLARRSLGLRAFGLGMTSHQGCRALPQR